ncbi:GerAB/ArcD/ProY family transporter [Paenibacillus sp. DXFW5]|uniref:GerAB/ArcD/ProY family transporter n=1 Tax=Paenibacillus rhizolycopersici TaxID=2780073 RepID=A0ABS2H8B7_9BACL|nr:GerAB/ArcD/ProY family transporter [Paenibacillus rhizolycopersici]
MSCVGGGVILHEKISVGQLASIVILFQIGSSSLFLLASEAKHDAWISVAIAMILGMGILIFITMPIQSRAPHWDLIEILTRYFGKYLGFTVGLAYVGYFIYKSVRNVREFGDLVILYLLPGTPLDVVMIVLLAVGAYAIIQGIEVFFRVGQLVLPWLLLIYLVLFGLMIVSGLVNLKQLLPLIEQGWMPIWNAAVPEVISFPFGEMVVFLIFWKHVTQFNDFKKFTLISYTFSGIFIVLTNVLIIAVLGDLSGAYIIPFMFGTSLIEIGGILERMDPFVSLLLFGGVFFKQATYYLAAVLAAAQLFKVKRQVMVVPVGIAIFAGARMFKSYMEQIQFGFEHNLKFHFPIFQIVLPILLLLVMLLTQGFKRKRDAPQNE